jgi:hypothetical protein
MNDSIAPARTRQPTSAFRFAVLTAFLLPFSIIPYLMARRKLSLLQRKFNEVGMAVARSQRDINSLSEHLTRREGQFQALLAKEMKALRLESEQRQKARIDSESVLRNDLRTLLGERKRIR